MLPSTCIWCIKSIQLCVLGLYMVKPKPAGDNSLFQEYKKPKIETPSPFLFIHCYRSLIIFFEFSSSS